MRVKVSIGCNVPGAHMVIEQRFRKQRKCLRLKANHVVETMIRDMYNKEFKDNAWLGKEWSVNDVTAVRLLEQSCKYEDSHFFEGLPWKMRMKVLACNRDLAFKILRKFKARFKTYPELWVWLKEVKPAHVAKGYVERVSIEQLGKLFLPHHPIVSPRKQIKCVLYLIA
ncbi:Gag-Pol polyprotein [Schistosoma japonicum]|nr:Gag-Pol polyprotein [Schistosoma japonicum]